MLDSAKHKAKLGLMLIPLALNVRTVCERLMEQLTIIRAIISVVTGVRTSLNQHLHPLTDKTVVL